MKTIWFRARMWLANRLLILERLRNLHVGWHICQSDLVELNERQRSHPNACRQSRRLPG